MKRLLISIPMGMSYRNLMQTEVVNTLKGKFEVVILSEIRPNKKEKITWLKYPKLNDAQRKILMFHNKINYFYFWLINKPDTAKEFIKKIKSNSFINYILQYFLATLWRALVKIDMTQKINFYLFSNKEYKKILNEEKIDAVFVPSFDTLQDKVLMTNSQKMSIPVICLAHSWDNLPARGSLVTQPDALLVWNHIMKKQAMKLHNIEEEKIKVVGIPQYDTYLYNTRMLTRETFMKKLGIEKYDKIITYTCSSIKAFPDEHLFISRLIEFVQQKLFGNTVLIIRLHPKYRQKEYMKLFQHKKNVILDIPDLSFAASYAKSGVDNGVRNFVNLVKHSDVVINLASTISIDAAVFDTPIINVAYNNSLSLSDWNSARRWYKTTHYKNIVATGGVKLAYSDKDLIRFIDEYLNNSSTDKEGRLKIVKEQCYTIDGKASSRILEAITEVVD